MKKYRESIMKVVFLVAACVSILAVVLICGFLFVNGFPAITEIGPLKFLTGVIWKPQEGEFGILPMIIGSIYATGIAILVGVPIGLLCSVFMARFCPQKLYKILKPAISLLAGIPSLCTDSSDWWSLCRSCRAFSAWEKVCSLRAFCWAL